MDLRLPTTWKQVTVLNGSGASEITVVSDEPASFAGAGYDHRQRQVWRWATSTKGRLALPVPPGGMLVLRRKDARGVRPRTR